MCAQIFHMVNIDMPAGVGAPSLDTTTFESAVCNVELKLIVIRLFLWYSWIQIKYVFFCVLAHINEYNLSVV